MANSGTPRRTGGGNRRPPGSGNRSAATSRRSGAPATVKPAAGGASPAGSESPSAARRGADERARERLSQPRTGAKRPQGRGRAPHRGDRRRHPQGRSTAFTAGVFGGAFVVLAVIIIVLVSVLSSSPSSATHPITWQAAPASLVTTVTHVSDSQFAAAGLASSEVSPTGVFVATPKQAAITAGGKPVLVYIGAEYCPYCAAARWPLVIALSRFGTFTGLGIIGSSPYDIYASTHTWSFARAHYSSPYLVFEPTELTTNICAVPLQSGACTKYTPLETPTAANSRRMTVYDYPPYFTSAGGGGIPFIDWAGKFVSSGVLYDPGLITPPSGTSYKPLNWSQIAATLSLPSTGVGEAILASANYYTAAICEMTHGKPASVCNLPVVKRAEAILAKS